MSEHDDALRRSTTLTEHCLRVQDQFQKAQRPFELDMARAIAQQAVTQQQRQCLFDLEGGPHGGERRRIDAAGIPWIIATPNTNDRGLTETGRYVASPDRPGVLVWKEVDRADPH